MKLCEFSHIHHISKAFLNDFYSHSTPIFILNTGRSGSALLQNIFKRFPKIDAHHEASPNLFLYSNFAFQNQEKQELLKNIIKSARIELMLQSGISQKTYLETNQCLVFFAYQLIELFPNARFIHLTRHPGDFVRSAIKKGWHKNDSVWEMGRIRSSDDEVWDNYSQIEKLSWVWNETHDFIENFIRRHPENCMQLKLENLVTSHKEFNKMLLFMGLDQKIKKRKFKSWFKIKHNEVRVAQNEPENMFKLKDYPKYQKWNIKDKEELKGIVEKRSQSYGYIL